MGIDVSHLVFVTFGDTNDQVVDEGLDSTKSGDILSGAMVNLHEELILRRLGEGDSDVRKILGQFACRLSVSPTFHRHHNRRYRILILHTTRRVFVFSNVPRGPSTVTSRDRM